MKIKIFTTGGTIDKVYSGGKGTYNFSFGKPAINEILGRLPLNFEYKTVALMAMDSLDMKDGDREIIKMACEETVENKILITHGTDTMIKTGEILSAIKDKTIVLTGSPKPYGFRESDAEFNIGAAIGALNVLEAGVYIAMSGRIYKWDECQKLESGIFTENK